MTYSSIITVTCICTYTHIWTDTLIQTTYWLHSVLYICVHVFRDAHLGLENLWGGLSLSPQPLVAKSSFSRVLVCHRVSCSFILRSGFPFTSLGFGWVYFQMASFEPECECVSLITAEGLSLACFALLVWKTVTLLPGVGGICSLTICLLCSLPEDLWQRKDNQEASRWFSGILGWSALSDSTALWLESVVFFNLLLQREKNIISMSEFM